MYDISSIVTPLFVPATKLDRLAKAAASGADAIILDLEDAVEPKDKVRAREELLQSQLPDLPIILRINASDTEWFVDDAKAAIDLNLSAVMLPKAEEIAQLSQLDGILGGALNIIALVETVRGIANLNKICATAAVTRLAFGSVDFAADLGCAHVRDSLSFARAQIVFASRLAALAAPLDGVTLSVSDADAAQDDARYASDLGFSGKLCIHPNQIVPVKMGFSPSEADLAWANKILESDGDGATKVDGMMVDAPVRRRAEQIVRRAVPAITQTKGIDRNV
ncbi:HpcH/HpaI aldolase/citrate lyase family protein [Granulosicoccus antarcticus]|uniref:Citrate lyase subunit beta-like protein n=1 Tax=Granulosicoccus antarcticus IMCC3135 TaxID=1192854 RepID=A0A2Z2NPW0_9GAMM|nr:CoA ester lyase [Granulosicoccus antarcticus]ASJ73462.1 Citrate lyase subunit beta-like protein [Granulosicoccus antarcticus IMCC3135]